MPWLIRFVVLNVLGPKVLRKIVARYGGPPGSRRAAMTGTAISLTDRYHRVKRLVILVAIAALALLLLILIALIWLIVTLAT